MILETATAVVCMANAIYFEGRSESIVAQVAIGQVIMNRVHDWRFPNTVCEVVTDGLRYKWNGSMVKHKCAFSFYCDGKTESINDTVDDGWENRLASGICPGGMSIE